ncbi:Asp23/Gls24 family envelope stress response protein [Actinomadura sp. BRA 177]|uniref:Asp23/Gls24 family envelope stress response protein n=1 Tax=Actinomadura sp. BRA 177 TaxID=2745202 RepID=UPI0015955D9B|nr:Asp23/Gls24 family envelope stress response protein [Actinomadura sp. BRA 177]NVI91369.1 Asp23/Gls24 family envelope stress response protein [Actinomadura sp. BRA 177]
MTGPDRRQTEGVEPRPDPGSMPYFPGMPQRSGTTPPRGAPLPAPPAPQAGAVPLTMHGSPGDVTVAVEGRITIEDAVLEKIAALAALEVAGVAGPAPAGARVTVAESDGDDEVTVDLVIAVEYGSVVKDVAQAVQGNVARVTGLMLGMRVAAVNVSVQDVRMPAAPPPPRRPAGQTPRA